MPTFKFTAPDGKQYTVNGPDGATEQQAFQMLQSQIKAAPTAAKPFGEQLNDTIKDTPRQVGLFARHGLEGVGDTLDFVASPIRAGLNAILPNKKLTLSDLVSERAPQPAITGRSGKALADLMHLPEPATANERVVGDATRMLAGGAIPIAGAARVAQNASGVTKTVAQNMAANPLQQLSSAGAAGAAGGYTRETGGNEGSQLLASLAAGVATPLAMNKAQQVGGGIRQLMNRAPVDPAQIEIKINSALHPSGMTLGQLAPDVQAGIRNDVAQALRTSDDLSPDALRRLVDYRMTGTMPTVGKLTRDPAQFTQEENLMRVGANSKDKAAQTLGMVKNKNNSRLIELMNETGAGTPDDALAGAQKVIGALQQRVDRVGVRIKDAYQAARDTSGRAAALDPHAFTNRANDLLDEALLGGKLPSDVRNLLNKAAAGEMPLTVDTAEQFKTRIGDLQRATTDLAEKKALGLVRGALDDTPLMPGQEIGQESINAFNRARRLNRTWRKAVENTPALQAVEDGIEPDKFVQQFITGAGPKANVADVAALRQSIKTSPEALATVKEQIAAHLKKSALNGAADEVGGVSQSAYNKALNAIGERKLRMFFTPQEVDQLKAIGRVASYEQVQPKGSAVNNANTAGAFAGILDRIAGSTLLSKMPLGRVLSQPAENISIGMKAKGALDAAKALPIGEGARNPLLLEQGRGMVLSPALLTGQQDEQR